MTSDIRDSIWECLGVMGLTLSTFLFLFGAAVWAQDTMSFRDAQQSQDIAVLRSQVGDLTRRQDNMESRFFGLFMTASGAVIASTTSAVFSFRVHKRMKNGLSDEKLREMACRVDK